MHANGLCVGAGVEYHFRLSHKAPFHEHPVFVHGAEWGHRADFALWVERGNLFLARQPQRYSVGEQAASRIHHVVGWEHRLARPVVSNTDDDFGPASLGDVRYGSLFCAVWRDMSEACGTRSV
jgi:hypothetical protein